MIKVKSTVQFDQTKLQQLSTAAVTALEQTADALYTEVVQAQVMPRDNGDLQNDTYVNTSRSRQGTVSIISPVIYARRLYFHPEYNFSKEKNPNARGEWYADWTDGPKTQEVIDIYKEIYRRLTRL